jgi:hypothetical protein
MVKIRFLPRRRKPPKALTDTISLVAVALRESSDAFPPLKSAAGGVAHILDLSRVRPSFKLWMPIPMPNCAVVFSEDQI